MGPFVGGISCHKRRLVRMNVGRYELRRCVLREEIRDGRFCTSLVDALWDDSQRRSQQVERPVVVEVAKFCRCSVRVRLIVCLEAVVWFLLPLRLWVKLTLHALQMLRGGVGERRAGAKTRLYQTLSTTYNNQYTQIFARRKVCLFPHRAISLRHRPLTPV